MKKAYITPDAMICTVDTDEVMIKVSGGTVVTGKKPDGETTPDGETDDYWDAWVRPMDKWHGGQEMW